MYSKVIVPLDGSELSSQALPYAQLVARSLSAPIELVQAYDILPPGMLGTQSQSIIDQITDSAPRSRGGFPGTGSGNTGRRRPCGQRVRTAGLCGRGHRRPGQHRSHRAGSNVHPRTGWYCPLGAGQRYRPGVAHHTQPNAHRPIHRNRPGSAGILAAKSRGASGRLAARRVGAAPRRRHCHRAVRWNPYHPRNAHAGTAIVSSSWHPPRTWAASPNSTRFPLKNWWQPTPMRSPSIWKT